LKTAFYDEVERELYPRMMSTPQAWQGTRLAEPLAWLAFLYRRLVDRARRRVPTPLILGVVERGRSRGFLNSVLFERVFDGLRKNGNEDYFIKLFGRRDLRSKQALIDRLGYSDELLLGMLLAPGEYSEPWPIEKYSALRRRPVPLPDGPDEDLVNFNLLAPGQRHGFPRVEAAYVHVSHTSSPLRVEVFPALGRDQIHAATRRAYLYASLLPGYGFPVGLHVVDHYARVPAWMTDAYGKLIQRHLSAGLLNGEISDDQLRRILVQAIYMTHRDWLFRPDL
jgi:hypothetical protein